jgi:ubiquinol-cytochrome c reductase cytochrome b subunit
VRASARAEKLAEVVYHGSYTKLDGITMSQAYESTLNISFDIRGGLLIRQIHHWAADMFVISICAHMLRHFFTGSYRKPRELNWLVGVVIFALALLEGLFGYSLPDDQLSGAGLRIFAGALLGIPIIGTYLSIFLFGGQFPGTQIVPRLYIFHVLLIPGVILALVTVHLIVVFYQKHTAMPEGKQTDRLVHGQPFFPYFILKGTAWFFFIFAAAALLATVAQINPIWQYGPYTPLAISSASQPDWYMGFLEGALRIMPAWEINFLGHTLSLSVLIPFLLPLGIIIAGAAIWPWFESWPTGDKAVPSHQRPAAERSVPHRHRRGGHGVLRRALGGGRQRRYRRPAPDPVVHRHVDRAGAGDRWSGDRIPGDPADLPRAAAQGPRKAGARRGDGHYQATA